MSWPSCGGYMRWPSSVGQNEVAVISSTSRGGKTRQSVNVGQTRLTGRHI
jgi:hypothetical protein